MSVGKIYLVGFGPGDEQNMTYKAKDAIKESSVIIGYSTYIKLVKELLDGKEVIKKGMTEEIDRCIEAYESAKKGNIVSLISSGDIGVYGMAGPTYEVLLQSGWTPESDIKVEIIPGSTALSACASLVGAPLTHDFCSISLSDLLTPWPTIAGRIKAAAKSDFVVALYNPKSGRRQQQIVEAQRILLNYRDAKTPVAIVKSAYREAQNIQMVTLDTMSDCKIGMLTTVLIGNSSTYMDQGLMITPRGYANKYAGITGDIKDGEKAGVSLSMGLLGWKACIRQYIRENYSASIKAIATHFNCSIKEILSAVAEGNSEDTSAGFEAQIINDSNFDNIITESKKWGSLRAVVRSDAGAVSELMMTGEQFIAKNNWLNIENQHFHLHIDWTKVTQAYFIQKNDSMRAIYFLNIHGDSIFNLSLVRADGEFDTIAETEYKTLWKQYSSQENTSDETSKVA
ncbi:Cobalt-precorrin-3 C(17)-methyltransferase [hydrothermal vent metagenome]|uniref:Cobalt-precorrin-3 C(17)-methyltransferase n=1 Tax=hydrothermal vent metagenome TaxID=652676 RepID=A0A3B1AAY3_9ZZZZ